MKTESGDGEFRLSQMIYERLLLAYPRSHRAEYGPAMMQLFRDQCRDAWNESRNWGLLKLWLRVLPDLASTSIMERLTASRKRKTMSDKISNLFRFRFTAPAVTFFGVFAVVFLVVLLVSVAITFILPESYASTARIKVEMDNENAAPNFFQVNKEFIQTNLNTIQSQVILDPVIEKLNLNTAWGKKYFNGQTLKTSETMEILKQRLQLAPVKNTKLVSITVYSDDRQEAARIANAIAGSYRDYRQKAYAAAREKAVDPVQQEFQQQEEQMKQVRTNMDALRAKTNIGSKISANPSSDEKLYWDMKSNLDQMLRVHELLYAKLEAERIDFDPPPRNMVLITDPAEPGAKPVKPNKPLNIAIGAVAGIFIASVAGAGFALLTFLIGKWTGKTATAI